MVIETLMIGIYAFFIYAEAWGPVLVPDLYPYFEKLLKKNPTNPVVLPNSTFKVTVQNTQNNSVWQHILLLITDNWFFNLLSDQMKLPENKDNQVLLNQNVVKVEKKQKIDKHTYSQVC